MNFDGDVLPAGPDDFGGSDEGSHYMVGSLSAGPDDFGVSDYPDVFEEARKAIVANPAARVGPMFNMHVGKAIHKVVEEGLKFDNDKVPLELLPFDALVEVAKVLQFGVKKYDARNWEKGINYGRIMGAATGHLWSWFCRDENDEETGLNHLAHAACCVLFLLAYEVRRGAGRDFSQFDDRPNGHAPVKR